MLWRISSGDDGVRGYLLGSFHAMKQEAYPLDSVFDEAFSEADLLVFEANRDSMQAKAQSLVRQLALYSPGQTLESELTDSTYGMLQKQADTLGLNLKRMQRMEPWMVSITIPARRMKQAGYDPNQGIDQHFFDKAKDAGKSVAAFETTEEQMRFFDNLSAKKQEAFLRHSLEEANRTVENIDEMVRYWKNGNAAGLENMMINQMRADVPELYKTLIVERNKRWMSRLTEMLKEESHPMVVVGAGHLVGEDGLVKMLEAEGYQLEQL